KPALPPKYNYPAPQFTDRKLPVGDLILSAAVNEHICAPTGSDVSRIEFYFSYISRLISNSFQRASRGLPTGFGYGIDPGSNAVPIAEVTFAGASGLHGHSIPAIELAVVQGAVEHGVMTLADLFAELGELERLLLVIFQFGGERANAEEPCGNVG